MVLATTTDFNALLPHTTHDCTETLPVVYVGGKNTEIELVPQPERIVAVAGTTQCNESIPATADAV
ncbi:hypothetical protein [Candidatus Chlorohelix sp.]|uniref:hypothetical protein n=1 Tax=Candidatus Chlorohelix sp. TaxID=3139201 RepID=UPI003023DE74